MFMHLFVCHAPSAVSGFHEAPYEYSVQEFPAVAVSVLHVLSPRNAKKLRIVVAGILYDMHI